MRQEPSTSAVRQEPSTSAVRQEPSTMPRGRSPLPCREAGALYLCREAGALCRRGRSPTRLDPQPFGEVHRGRWAQTLLRPRAQCGSAIAP